MTLAELSKKYGVHSGQISTWKRVALDNMISAFQRRGRDSEPEVSALEIEKAALEDWAVGGRAGFLADASRQQKKI